MAECSFACAGAALCLAAAAWAVVRLVREKDGQGPGPEVVLALGLLGIGGLLIARATRTGSFPVTDLGESLAAFALALGVCHLALARSPENRGLGAFVIPVAAGLATASAVAVCVLAPPSREFHAAFLVVHATTSFAAYGAFTFGCGASAAYLLQERSLRTKRLGILFRRLPSLSALDALGLRSIEIGFPLLTVAIATGSAWAHREWGTLWRWEPKLTLALLLWLLGAAAFHMRTIERRQGRRTAVFMVVSGAMVFVVFVGAALIPGGLHAFL